MGRSTKIITLFLLLLTITALGLLTVACKPDQNITIKGGPTVKVDCSTVTPDEIVDNIYSSLASNTRLRKQMMHINVKSSADKQVTLQGWVSDPMYHYTVIFIAEQASCKKPVLETNFKSTSGAYTWPKNPNGCTGGQVACNGMCVDPGTCSLDSTP